MMDALPGAGLIFAIRDLPLPPAGVNHQYQPRATSTAITVPATGVMSLSDYRQVARASGTQGGRVLTAQMQQYRTAMLALLDQGWGDIAYQPGLKEWARLTGSDLHVDMTFAIRRSSYYKRDVDGLVKFPLDIVCNWLGLNDARFTRLVATKRAVLTAQDERLAITITAQGETAPRGPRGRGKRKAA